MVPCIKHYGMAPCNPVVDDYLCVLMNFWAGIESSHCPLTAHIPSWIQNQAPLAGELVSALGHIIGFYHPNPQHS